VLLKYPDIYKGKGVRFYKKWIFLKMRKKAR